MHLRGNRRWVSMVFGAHVFLYIFRSTYFRLFFHLLFSFFLGGGGGCSMGEGASHPIPPSLWIRPWVLQFSFFQIMFCTYHHPDKYPCYKRQQNCQGNDGETAANGIPDFPIPDP